jgi:hypothetical protein
MFFERGIDPRPTGLFALCDRALEASVAKLPELLRKSFAVQAQHRYWMTQNANLRFIRVR